jgi:hypothetical protein
MAPDGDTPAVDSTSPAATDNVPSAAIGIAFWVVGGAVALALTAGKSIVFAKPWTPWAFGAGLLFVVSVPFWFKRSRAWIKTSAPRQGALLTFGITPLLLAIVLVLVLAPPGWQFGLLRIGVIFVVCLAPPSLYYLFIVTRKGSLLNEFVANLARLGLLTRRVTGPNWETDTERRRRVEAYLQKFEAAFGQIPDDQRQSILAGPNETLKPVKVSRATVGEVFVAEAAAPVVTATFLTALLWLVTLPPVELNLASKLFALGDTVLQLGAPVDAELTPWWYALRPNLTPVTAAFLGAYFFSLQLLFRRYVRKDLRPSAYMGVVLRIVLSVIGIWIVALIGTSVLQIGAVGLTFVGFVIGVFPRVVFQILEGAVKNLVPTVVLPSLRSELPISDLDGLTVWHEARLEDEDIENTPNMATADVLELMINTRFPADRLVDWVDQAILYTCLGPEARGENGARARLARHGIRTATAFTEAYRQAAEEDQDLTAFEKILVDDPRPVARGLADAIDTMPNTQLVRVWRGLPATGFRVPTGEPKKTGLLDRVPSRQGARLGEVGAHPLPVAEAVEDSL